MFLVFILWPRNSFSKKIVLGMDYQGKLVSKIIPDSLSEPARRAGKRRSYQNISLAGGGFAPACHSSSF